MGRVPAPCEDSSIFVLPTAARAAEVLLTGWSAQGRARIVQVAADGRWEESRSVKVPADDASARGLVRGAGPGDADVAVEHEWLGRPLVFVGARRAGDATAFEADVVAVAGGDVAEPLRALATLAGGPPEGLDHVELGAANAWLSVGPLRLWTRGDDAIAPALEGRLADHPALGRSAAPVALTVSFGRPRECWIGVEISTPSGDRHVVAAATVQEFVRRLFGAD